jgi:hypothetical protein
MAALSGASPLRWSATLAWASPNAAADLARGAVAACAAVFAVARTVEGFAAFASEALACVEGTDKVCALRSPDGASLHAAVSPSPHDADISCGGGEWLQPSKIRPSAPATSALKQSLRQMIRSRPQFLLR